jgi:hypothetical protein
MITYCDADLERRLLSIAVMGYTHWLVGWLVGWSIGWLVGQSSGWLVNPLVGWSILWLVGQSSGLLRKARGQGGNGAPI